MKDSQQFENCSLVCFVHLPIRRTDCHYYVTVSHTVQTVSLTGVDVIVHEGKSQ